MMDADPLVNEMANLLARVLIRVGMVSDVPMTGPQVQCAGEDFLAATEGVQFPTPDAIAVRDGIIRRLTEGWEWEVEHAQWVKSLRVAMFQDPEFFFEPMSEAEVTAWTEIMQGGPHVDR